MAVTPKRIANPLYVIAQRRPVSAQRFRVGVAESGSIAAFPVMASRDASRGVSAAGGEAAAARAIEWMPALSQKRRPHAARRMRRLMNRRIFGRKPVTDGSDEYSSFIASR